MIKAIIFDFAGVIGTDSYWQWLEQKMPDIEQKREIFDQLANKVDKGEISNNEFVRALSEKLHVPPERVWKEIFPLTVINYELLGIIEILKKKYKIALFSNYTHEWLKEIIEKHHLSKHFDVIFISSEHGMRKPEAMAFQKILDMLGVTKEEAIFVDDRKNNLDAAKVFGIQSFQYTTPAVLREDLQKAGIQ